MSVPRFSRPANDAKRAKDKPKAKADKLKARDKAAVSSHANRVNTPILVTPGDHANHASSAPTNHAIRGTSPSNGPSSLASPDVMIAGLNRAEISPAPIVPHHPNQKRKPAGSSVG
jgi:hypothetical protein